MLEPNLVEVRNAVEQTAKEIGTRFDFKGTSAAIELKDKEITLIGDADFQIGQVMDILIATSSRSAASTCATSTAPPSVEKIGGDKVKQRLRRQERHRFGHRQEDPDRR